MAGDIADREPELARPQGERVIPLPTDPTLPGRDVASGEPYPRAAWEPGGKEAPLERLSCYPLHLAPTTAHGIGHPVRHELQRPGVLRREPARYQGTPWRPMSTGGRGLVVVDALSLDWGQRRLALGKIVWAVVAARR